MTLTIVPTGPGKACRIPARLTDRTQQGVVRPERVLAASFAEAAAAELSGRIRQSLPAAGTVEEAMAVERAYVSTIHGLGLQLLTEHALASGAAPPPRPPSEAEQDLTIRRNWRSDPHLTAAIDAVGAGPFGAAHMPLAPMRAEAGLGAGAPVAITAQVVALKGRLPREACPDLRAEAPIHVAHPDGLETMGILDAAAMGPGRPPVIDHETVPAPDPRARFSSFRPQLPACADGHRSTIPAQEPRGVATHWTNEGARSFPPLEPETVA